jgi:hypothetical protein
MDNSREEFPCQKESPRRKAGAKPEDIMKGKGIGQSLHALRYDNKFRAIYVPSKIPTLNVLLTNL